MQAVNIFDIAAAIGARYDGPAGEVDYISTDSRDIRGSCLFVALTGERVDGHNYIGDALRAGAAYAVADRPVPIADPRVLYVDDTFPVLLKIARLYRDRFSPLMVGITGSVGKTTTKEFCAAVLSQGYITLKNEGNQNNEIGLPKTIFRLDLSTEAAVLEMGMSGMREIALLAGIVRPQIGVITNIGMSHIELLGSKENILRAKLEITEGMPLGSPLIINSDDPLLAETRVNHLRLCRYGIDDRTADIRARNVREEDDRTIFEVLIRPGFTTEEFPAFEVELPTLGIHNVYNALAAVGVGLLAGIRPAQIASALRTYTPSGMRQRMVRWRGATVVEDCYNASPDSMHAALETMARMRVGGRKICVFADMLELGLLSQAAHVEVGRQLAAVDCDLLITFGEQAQLYAEGALGVRDIEHLHIHSHVGLGHELAQLLRPGDLVWVKGSRGMALEEALEVLYSFGPGDEE